MGPKYPSKNLARFNRCLELLNEIGIAGLESNGYERPGFERLQLDTDSLTKENPDPADLDKLKKWLRPDQDVDEEDWIEPNLGAIEILAWYQPMSYYGQDAGIFITLRGLRILGGRILRALEGQLNPPADAPRIAILAAIAQLLTHEIFHHEVEFMALRFDATFGFQPQIGSGSGPVSRYDRYHSEVYRKDLHLPPRGSLEEALASASEYRNFPASVFGFKFGNDVKSTVRRVIRNNYYRRPVGYRDAERYLSLEQIRAAVGELLSQLHGPKPAPNQSASDPFLGIQRSDLHQYFLRSWTLVDDGRSGNPNDLPMTLTIPDSGLKRLLKSRGFLPTDRGNGSHVVWIKSGAPDITIPHRKDQEGYDFLKSTARSLGLKNIRELAEAARRS